MVHLAQTPAGGGGCQLRKGGEGSAGFQTLVPTLPWGGRARMGQRPVLHCSLNSGRDKLARNPAVQLACHHSPAQPSGISETVLDAGTDGHGHGSQDGKWSNSPFSPHVMLTLLFSWQPPVPRTAPPTQTWWPCEQRSVMESPVLTGRILALLLVR